MFKSLAIISVLQYFAAACSENLKIETVGSRSPTLSEESCDMRPETTGCSDFLDDLAKKRLFKLDQLTTINSYQDQVVKLYGGSFDDHLEVTIEGNEVPVFQTSESEAFFITPSFDSPGMKNGALKRLDSSIEFKIFIIADRSINPTSLTEPSQLCEGNEFMMADGSIAVGTRSCANTARAVNCSEDGEVGCITTSIYTAADTTSAANKIVAGESIGGIQGTYIAPAPGKVLSGTSYGVGGTASTGTLSLPVVAAVRVSAGSYGDPGSPIMGTLADCADGDIGCNIVGPSFKAMAVTGSTGDKILFGQTLAGISGTITLPLASKVLTGTSYGIGGNGLAGSLTLPSAANVLSGSGTYGDALSPLTPILTLPNSSKVLTGTSFGSSGSASSGALTLPAAGNVLAGSGSYGDSLSQTSPTYVCPAYVRPASPGIASVNFDMAPDRVTITWGAIAGAAGYIMIMRSNAAVSWTPTDGQSYATGAQGSDTIIYSGSGTSVTYNTDVTAGITYSFAVYSYIANHIYSYLPSTSSMTSCAGLSGSWVAVPGDSTYGTSGFCVMKYEAKNVSNVATSAASGSPWVSISQTAAQDACQTLGANFHLITNNEWMTLASNIANSASNWSGGTVSSGTMNRGHSDNNPVSACAASIDDSYGYVEADCTPLNSGSWSQKRTHTLSTGAVIWDVAGNVWDWTSYVISNNSTKPYVLTDGSPQASYKELSAVNADFTAMTLHDLRPINSEKAFWSDAWNSSQGAGQYYAGPNGSGGALRRGGSWGSGTYAGALSAYLDALSSAAGSTVGFRCTRVASP